MQRVTVNPKTGRTEHVFVNLDALYPHNGRPDTELSFEELMAGHRGWLKKVWRPETDHSSTNSRGGTNNMNESPSDGDTGLHNAIVLDENGVVKDTNREGKARKMKIKEINETQISKPPYIARLKL